MPHDVVISVVLYHNTRQQVQKLMQSMVTDQCNVQLVFIDNAPNSSSFFSEMRLPPNVHYIALSKNIGYGAAHNKVILNPKFRTRYNIICNPDVHFKPEILFKMVHFLDANPRIGLLMPKVIWPDGKDQGLRKLLPAPADLFLRRFLPKPLRTLFKTRENKYQLAHLNPDEAMFVPVLSGCFMVCRHSLLQQIQGFDERFFLYLEDVDLSRRMGKIAENLFWPHVQIVHEYQKDSYKDGVHLKRHLRSAWQYFNKHGWLFDKTRKRVNKKAIAQKQM